MCLGASQQQTDAQTLEAANASASNTFSALLRQDFQTLFGNNQNIINSLQGALEPLIQLGPNGEGFSPTELAAQRTGASDAVAQGAQNAQIAANARAGATGDASIPSGAQQQISAQINAAAGNEDAREQNQITTNDYATGRQNFFTAVDALPSVTNTLENATSTFGNTVTGSTNATTGAASSSMQGATDITNANNAWLAPVLGMVGSLGGAALGKSK